MTLHEQFNIAYAKLGQAREAINRETTNEDRAAKATGVGLDALHKEAKDTARRFIADAAGRHHIEERAVVWLRLDDDGTWTVDSPSDDGYPLEGYDDGALNSECDDEDEDGDEHDDDECEALTRAVNEFAPRPTLRQLRDIINAHLGD